MLDMRISCFVMVENVRRGNVIAYYSVRPCLNLPSEPPANLATTACAKTA